MRVSHLIGVAALALGFASCTPDFATQDESQVILRVTNISATAGGEGTGGIFLLSDVLDTAGGGFHDKLALTLEAVPQNSNPATGLGKIHHTIIDRLPVHYVPPDRPH